MDLLDLIKEEFTGKLVKIQSDPHQNTNFFDRWVQDTNSYQVTPLNPDMKPKEEKISIPLGTVGIVAEVKNPNRSHTKFNVLFGEHLVELSMIEVILLEEDLDECNETKSSS